MRGGGGGGRGLDSNTEKNGFPWKQFKYSDILLKLYRGHDFGKRICSIIYLRVERECSPRVRNDHSP